MNESLELITPLSDLLIVGLGIFVAIFAVLCALEEERECVRLPRECAAVGPALFDVYRALSVVGLTSICVGLSNLGFWYMSVPVSFHGISWSLKTGAVFFLWVRWRYYRNRSAHGFLSNHPLLRSKQNHNPGAGVGKYIGKIYQWFVSRGKTYRQGRTG